MDQFQKLRAAMEDEDGCIDDVFLKPKWMRWSTFHRKVTRIEALENAVEVGLGAAHEAPALNYGLARQDKAGRLGTGSDRPENASEHTAGI